MNDSISTYLRAFALPGTDFDESFAKELAVAHARETVLRLLQRHSQAFVAAGPTVSETIRLAASGPLEFDDVWCRPIGAAWGNLRSDPACPADLVVPLLADWAARQLHSVDANRFPGVRISPGALEVHIKYRENFPAGDAMRDDTLSSKEHLFVTQVLHDALDVLDRFAPDYSLWVLRLLREIVPLESASDCMRSGSSVAEPGSCHMSFRNGPVALAEMLVHETTHQYYYLITRFGPVDDGTDQQLYYSPAKQCGRPIAYILIAYHAFANVLLFSRQCLAAGHKDEDGHLHRNVDTLTGWTETLDEALQKTNALTGCGLALWLPLARELQVKNDLANETRSAAAELIAQPG